MPTYKLTYFNARARGEVSRILFAKAGVAYEDRRVTSEEWPKLKESTPFGALPVLEVDGVPVAQSFAITSYLAKTFGLHGKTDIEEAQVSSICLSMDEVFNDFAAIMGEKDETRKAALMKKMKEDKLPNLLKFLNKIIVKSGSSYFVGLQMTLADMYFYYAMEAPKAFGIVLDLSTCPKLQEVRSKVENDPRIAAWLKKRPQTPF